MSAENKWLAARMICAGFTPHNRHVIDELIDRGIGAVILFSRNITGGPEEVAGLVAELKERAASREPTARGADTERRLLIAIDHEGGRVARMREGFSAIPSMRELGRTIEQTGDYSLAREVGRIIGRELRAVGIDINFAPVVDVDTNPANPVIGERSLSRDPAVVARAGAELVRGMQEQGVAACCKHFPGHGDTSVDSHFELPCVEHDLKRLEQVELPPFRAGIEAGVSSIMTAHVVMKALDAERPATISGAVLQGLLRQKLRFSGVIVSDDFEMKALANHFAFDDAVVGGVQAGLDLVCVCHTPQLQQRAIELIASRISEERLRESGARLDALCDRFWRAASESASSPAPRSGVDLSIVGCDEHRRVLAGIERAEAGIDPTESWRA